MPTLIFPENARLNPSKKSSQLNMQLANHSKKLIHSLPKMVSNNNNQYNELKQTAVYLQGKKRAKKTIFLDEKELDESELNESVSLADSAKPALHEAAMLNLAQNSLADAEMVEGVETNSGPWLQPVALGGETVPAINADYSQSTAPKSGGISTGWLIGGGLLVAAGAAVALSGGGNSTKSSTTINPEYRKKKNEFEKFYSLYKNVRGYVNSLEKELKIYEETGRKLSTSTLYQLTSRLDELESILEKEDFLKKHLISIPKEWVNNFELKMKNFDKEIDAVDESNKAQKIQEITVKRAKIFVEEFKIILKKILPAFEAEQKEIEALPDRIITHHSPLQKEKVLSKEKLNKEEKSLSEKTFFDKPKTESKVLFESDKPSLPKIEMPISSDNHSVEELAAQTLY